MFNVDAVDKHPDTEQLILEAAEQEFLNKGFEGARTTAIAEKAGVTHAMLHYYFRTKEKLFNRIIESKSSGMRGVMFGFIENEEMPLLERVEQSMRRHFAFIEKNPDLPLFLINELRRGDSKVLEHILFNKDAAHEIKRSLQKAIDEAAERGECKHVDAQMLILDILSLNVALFIAKPLIERVFADIYEPQEDFLHRRLEENIKTILNKLRP